MIKILSIGNSFSQDATRYLYALARKEGVDMRVINLYIGGCPLSRHYSNMLSEDREYDFELNGASSGIKVSLKDGLLAEKCDGWDFITLQQVSSKSFDYETYQPYLSRLAEYVRTYSPKAKLFMHQTWSYAQDSPRLTQELGYKKQEDMFSDVKSAYQKAASDIGAGIIPCGETMQNLIKCGKKVHRDGFHADLGYARFALSATWFETLTGLSAEKTAFDDFDKPVTVEEQKLAKEAAHAAVSSYQPNRGII